MKKSALNVTIDKELYDLILCLKGNTSMIVNNILKRFYPESIDQQIDEHKAAIIRLEEVKRLLIEYKAKERIRSKRIITSIFPKISEILRKAPDNAKIWVGIVAERTGIILSPEELLEVVK